MPHGIAVDAEDNIWVTDVALHQALKVGKPDTCVTVYWADVSGSNGQIGHSHTHTNTHTLTQTLTHTHTNTLTHTHTHTNDATAAVLSTVTRKK